MSFLFLYKFKNICKTMEEQKICSMNNKHYIVLNKHKKCLFIYKIGYIYKKVGERGCILILMDVYYIT